MKARSIKYLTGEGFKNVWANRLMTVASVGVLVACMVLIGLAILLSLNIDVAMGNLEKQNVVMVYFNDKNSVLYGDAEPILAENETFDKNDIKDTQYLVHNDEEATAICKEIEKLDNIEKVEYIPKTSALDSVKEDMLNGKEQYFQFLDEDGGNPLSDGARVSLVSMDKFEETVNNIENIKGVNSTQSQKDLATKISAIKNGVGIAGFWIIAILLIISLVIVSNTIRVTMYNRKLQISIMKAVGATDSFVRFPFFIEGVIIGLISAVLAECVVYFCYRVATDTICATLGTSNIIPFASVSWQLFGVFAGIGIIAGALGSFVMISKYLRHEGSEFTAI